MRKRALFAAVMVLGPLLVAEGFFRARESVREARKAEKGGLLSPREPDTFRNMVLSPGARLEAHEGAHLSIINSLGMRAPEPRDRQGGDVRVICIGGSSTYGLYCSHNDRTWPARTEAHLAAQPGGRIEVLNGGCPAWTLRDGQTNLELRLYDLRPDVVIACHVYNDVVDNLSPIYEQDSHVEGVWGLWRPQNGSALYRFLMSRFRSPRDLLRQKAGAWRPEGLAAYERNLRRFVRRTRERGAVPVLATEPTCYRPTLEESVAAGVPGLEQWFHELSPLDYPALLSALAAYNDEVRQVARAEGVALIDLDHELPDDVALFMTPVHHSDAGEEVVAGIVARALVEQGVLPRAGAR